MKQFERFLKGVSLFCLLIFGSCSSPNLYYIDSQNGNNDYCGHRPEKAWANLDKINEHSFLPGDKILFKAGTYYEGQLNPKGSGTKEQPIIIDTYGEGEKPVIQGQGKHLTTVLLENAEYWEINRLKITNQGPERVAGRRGVTIHAKDFGDCNHIYLNELEIHDVNGSLVKSDGGGGAILWHNEGDSIKTRFVDLRIENCHLFRCGRNGINSRGYTNRENWHPSVGVVIRNNVLEEIPGDGIVPIGCDGALIEYNVMRNCPDILSHQEAAAGIWPWSSDNTIIQYNEVSGHNAKWDGQGFDSDWNCKNTIIQYNYSHDNAGGFLLVCNNGNNIGTNRNIGTINTIVRYNVSINDGIRSYPTERRGYFSPTMHISGPVSNTLIYNNVFIIPPKPKPELDRTLVQVDNWGGPWPDSTLFANNIFYVQETSDFYWGKSKRNYMTHNLYYGQFENNLDDPNAVYNTPEWVGEIPRTSGFSSLKNLKLKRNSPAINAGITILNHAVEDFFGNHIPTNENPNIGIFENEVQ